MILRTLTDTLLFLVGPEKKFSAIAHASSANDAFLHAQNGMTLPTH